MTQLTLGRFADRGFAPLLVRVGMGAAGVSTFAFALGSSFWVFVVARGAFGVAMNDRRARVRNLIRVGG